MNKANNLPWEQVHEQATIVDLHAHPVLKALLFEHDLSLRQPGSPWIGDLNPIDVQTAFPLLDDGNVSVLFSTGYPLEKRLLNDIRLFKLLPLSWLRYLPIPLVRNFWQKVVEPPYFSVAMTMLDTMEKAAEQYNLKNPKRKVRIAHSKQELTTYLNSPEKPIVLVHSMEGGHSLEGKFGLELIEKPWDALSPTEKEKLKKEVLENLDALAKRGVAYLVLAHFYPNKLIMPVFPYPEHIALSLLPRDKLENVWRDVDLTGGLTELGREVVKHMIEIGMLIDITHATPKARQDIYDLVDHLPKDSAKPPRPSVIATHVGAYAINPSPYNLDDWEIKWIADHNGIIGVIFMTYWLMPQESKFGMNFLSRTIEHIIKVGGQEVIGIGTDFDGADPPDDLVNESQLPKLTERLYSEYSTTGTRKYTDQQIRQILGGNALRVLQAGWQ